MEESAMSIRPMGYSHYMGPGPGMGPGSMGSNKLCISAHIGLGEGQGFGPIVTGRNEVVAKVIFLHLFVILFRGGRYLPQCMLGYHIPGVDTPWSRHPPAADTPGSRHPPGADTTPPGADTPPLGADPPGADTPREQTPPRADTPWRQTPPRGRHPPDGRHPSPRSRHPQRKQTLAYAAGTHPTGMHSCFLLCDSRSLHWSLSRAVWLSHKTFQKLHCFCPLLLMVPLLESNASKQKQQ